MRRLLPLLLFLGACSDNVRGNAPLSDAHLTEPICFSLVLFVGATICGADLTVTSVAGESDTMPVLLVGVDAGLGVEASFYGRTGTEIDIELPADGLTKRQLFGKYEGTAWSLVLAAGARGRELENHRGARFGFTGIGMGGGLWFGQEWLWMYRRR